jgi:hypothetical protein
MTPDLFEFKLGETKGRQAVLSPPLEGIIPKTFIYLP